MTTIYLMRHGQTYFNLWHKIQGWTDSPLTDKGIRQAKEMGKYFKDQNIHFDSGYASTSERASDTLELATDNQLPYKRLKGLKKWNFGSFEAEDERLNPPVPYKDFFVRYGGEDQKQVMKRMHSALVEIAKENEGKNVLVVSHAGAIFNFFRSIDADAKKIHNIGFSNCSIAKIEFENDHFKVVSVINEKNNHVTETKI